MIKSRGATNRTDWRPITRLIVAATVAGAAGAQPAGTPPQATAAAQDVPAFRQLAPGLLTRTRFVVDETDGRRVEILDLLVGPGMRSTRTSLGGDGVLEVRAGEAVLTVGDNPRRVRSGVIVPIARGVTFEIANLRSDLDVSVRATVISERAR